MNNDLIVNVRPKSAFSESIKTIRTNLTFTSLKDKIKTILITSAQAGDGKSFISANLALAYAQEGKKVLIIDCDLRRGRQHEIFKTGNSRRGGYSKLILDFDEETDLSKYIVSTGNDKVNLLPTGPMPPNPVELLGSDNNQKLLTKLRKYYHIIILDCPPVLGLSDTLIMTKYSDANVIVASSNITQFDNLERTKKAFEQVEAPITGVVLNRAKYKDNGYYSYYSTNGEEEETHKE